MYIRICIFIYTHVCIHVCVCDVEFCGVDTRETETEEVTEYVYMYTCTYEGDMLNHQS